MDNNSNDFCQMQILVEKFVRSKKSKSLELSSYHITLLFILSSYMGNKNSCWPTLECLIEDCRIKKTKLIESIKELEEKKIIFVKRNHRKNNKYSINIEMLVSYCEHKLIFRVRTTYPLGTYYEPNRVRVANPNNIINNNNNNKGNFSNFNQKQKDNEPKQVAKFWGKGHPDYDRLNKK